MRPFLAGLLALISWVAHTEAYYGIDEHAKAGYFNFNNGEYVFAMNPTASGDIYFHMSAPMKGTCWIGGGFGTGMDDALMFIGYPSANGSKLTVSPRIGSGHSEPVYTPYIEVFGIYNDTYAPNAMSVTDTGTLIAHGACRNCTQWATGALDFNDKAQPMIFALGPSCSIQSDDLEASIPRHRTYGRYTMDMTQASNATGWYGRVPAPNIPDFIFPPTDAAFVSVWTTPEFDVHNMKNVMGPVHAAFMCVAFLLVFPLGSLLLVFLKKVLVHAALQVFGVILVIAGFGIGASMSGQFNKVHTSHPCLTHTLLANHHAQSKDFASAHQGIGLLIVAALLIQLSLGIIHHTVYVKTKTPTMFGKVHFFLGPGIMILGLINAGLGFNFAGRPGLNLPYGIIAAVVAVVFAGVLGCLMCFKQRRKYRPESDGPIQSSFPPAGHQPEVPGTYQDYELGRAPTYGSAPPEAYEPTTPYSPQFASPFTPVSAYTPVTPQTWKKEEIERWSSLPRDFKGDGGGGGFR